MLFDLVWDLGMPLRAALAAAVALGVGLVATPALARAATRRRFGDREGKSESDTLNELHAKKRSTPIVGGLGMLAGTTLATLAAADPGALVPWVFLAALLLLGALGLVDDWTKTFGAAKTRGLTPRQKLAGQISVAAGVAGVLVLRSALSTDGGGLDLAGLTALHVPVVGWAVPLGVVGFVGLVAVVMTGASNAVNLTDGLDGLAGGCALAATGAYTVVAAVAGDATLSARLGLPHVPGAGELCVPLAALGGSLTAFLVYNRHPARVFMGDAGSLPLGGALGLAAVLVKQELLLVLIGGVFVAETLSVFAQVASFKLTGKRVLRCAPLHHHYEFLGWPERRVVGRFHAAALALAVLGVVGLCARASAAQPIATEAR
jgi:phospho-N-acetylmuramoyl-pentapeptide-transferase